MNGRHAPWCPCWTCRPEHGDEPIPRYSETGWHYLIHFPDGTVVQCPGDWDVAHKHLRMIRADWDGDTVPTLIGAYPPHSIGGPEGHGGIVSLGYTPNFIGSIDHPREEWIRT